MLQPGSTKALQQNAHLTVQQLMPRVFEATVMTGKAKGENMFIPGIPIIPSDMPIQFKRLQFPVKLSFAVSINQAQGSRGSDSALLNLCSPTASSTWVAPE